MHASSSRLDFPLRLVGKSGRTSSGRSTPMNVLGNASTPDQAAIDACLASPIRPESHRATVAVMKLFDGRFYHVVAEATELSPSA